MQLHEALHDALERRGRTWGERNDERLAEMRAQLSGLQKRPRLRAMMMVKYFAGKNAIGHDTGCYVRGGSTLDTGEE